MIIKDLVDFHHSLSIIDGVDELIDRLGEKGFNYRDVTRCRHLFPRWSLQTILLQRVLFILHFIETPNSTEEELRSTIKYLTSQKNILPDIWNWAGIRESHVNQLRIKITSSIDFADASELSPKFMWALDEDTYENIAHKAVRLDNLRLTKLLCSFQNCSQIMQRNYSCETACHLAISQWYLSHVTYFITCQSFHVDAVDNNGRSVLAHLLYVCVQRIRRKIQVECNMVAHLVDLLLSCVDISNWHHLFGADVCGLSAVSYAVATLNSQIIHAVLSKYELTKPIDLGILLRQAILFNNAATTDALAAAYLRSDSTMTRTVTGGQFETDLASHLSFAVTHNRSRSLLTLLSHREFITALNSSLAHTTWMSMHSRLAICVHMNVYTLQTAVESLKYFANAESLRVLLKFGVNVLARQQDRQSLCASRQMIMVSQKLTPTSLQFTPRILNWTKLFQECHFQLPSQHDNIFSFAAAIVRSVASSASLHQIEAGAIDSLRYLLRSKPDAICHVPSISRRIQANEIAWTPQEAPPGTSSSLEKLDIGGNLDYFMDYALFSCSPIVTAVLSSQSTRNRRGHPGDVIPYHTHSSRELDTPNTFGSSVVEHLLCHTPFKALIDSQESVSGLTPLAAACAAGSVGLVNLLLLHGAQPNMKINACITSKLFVTNTI